MKERKINLPPTATTDTAAAAAGASAIVCSPPLPLIVCHPHRCIACYPCHCLLPLLWSVTLVLLCPSSSSSSSPSLPSSSSLPLLSSVTLVLVGAAPALICLWSSTGLPQLFVQCSLSFAEHPLSFMLPLLVQCPPLFICGLQLACLVHSCRLKQHLLSFAQHSLWFMLPSLVQRPPSFLFVLFLPVQSLIRFNIIVLTCLVFHLWCGLPIPEKQQKS